VRIQLDPGEPLGWLDEQAIVYGALGAYFQLEELRPDDEARLEQVNDLVWDWLGAELSWTLLSAGLDAEPAQRSLLEYISGYPAGLEAMPVPTEELQFTSNNVIKSTRTNYSVISWGAEPEGSITPYSYRFWAEIGAVPRDSTRLPAYAILKLTVPESWPLDDFERRVLEIARVLRLRWGAAGLTYASFELADLGSAEQVEYAHARRYPGYDLGYYVLRAEQFYRRLRTINWLTFVGPALLAEREAAAGPLASTALVEVRPLEGGAVLRAGPRPERGDLNRLKLPAAYREADALVRSIRHDGERLDFLNPWDAATTARWIRRFELRPL